MDFAGGDGWVMSQDYAMDALSPPCPVAACRRPPEGGPTQTGVLVPFPLFPIDPALAGYFAGSLIWFLPSE